MLLPVTMIRAQILQGNGTTSTCNTTFFDSNPGGNYANNENSIRIICPSTPGQYMRASFTTFNLENGYDYLIIHDGNTAAAPIIGTYTGGASPGNVTATNPSGCLSFRFYSDNITTSVGWSANMTCTALAPAPTVGSAQDCGGGGGITICSNTAFGGNSSGAGDQELLGAWDGCLNREHQSSWYYFSPSSSGTLAFTIAPVNGADDYDFALWGPFATVQCPAYSSVAPLRCSYSQYGGNTGLIAGAGDNSEDDMGDRWVNPINVTAGQVYVMVIDNYTQSSQPFNFTWALSAGASLDCTPLPIELAEFGGEAEDHHNYIHWTTSAEINNEYFTVEKSADGTSWTELGRVTGAGNSNSLVSYEMIDPVPYAGTYYRLKQTDFDGQFEYFDMIFIQRALGGTEPGEAFSIYPNPVENILNIETYTEGDHTVTIVDETGRTVLSRELDHAILHQLDLGGLRSGLYSIGISDGNSISYRKLVRK